MGYLPAQAVQSLQYLQRLLPRCSICQLPVGQQCFRTFGATDEAVHMLRLPGGVVEVLAQNVELDAARQQFVGQQRTDAEVQVHHPRAVELLQKCIVAGKEVEPGYRFIHLPYELEVAVLHDVKIPLQAQHRPPALRAAGTMEGILRQLVRSGLFRVRKLPVGQQQRHRQAGRAILVHTAQPLAHGAGRAWSVGLSVPPAQQLFQLVHVGGLVGLVQHLQHRCQLCFSLLFGHPVDGYRPFDDLELKAVVSHRFTNFPPKL